MRWDALGVAELSGHDAQMAVLDTGIEANTVAPVPELFVECRDDRCALLTRRVTGGEVDHHRRCGVVQRDQVAAERDVVGPEIDAHRCRLDRRTPGVEARRVVPENRHVADVAARRKPLGDHRRPADFGARSEARECGHRRRLERGAIVELGERLVGTTVRHEHDVLHGRNATRGPFTILTR